MLQPMVGVTADSGAQFGLPYPIPPGLATPGMYPFLQMQPIPVSSSFPVAPDGSVLIADDVGHFQGGLFIPNIPPAEQRFIMPPQGPPQGIPPAQPIASGQTQPKSRSHALPIIPPQVGFIVRVVTMAI